MTLRHFKIFIAVVDYNRVRKAAEALYISQPAVSQAIAELEEHYQVKLFDRISQRLYLTHMGEMLLPYARQAVEIFEATELMMQQKRKTERLRIGASVSVGTTLLHELLNRYEEIYDKIDVNVVVNNTPTIEEMIRQSKLDIGIVEGTVENPDLIQYPVCKDELVLIVGNTHPLYQKQQLKLDDLNGETLISREEASVSRNQLEQLLVEQQIRVNKSWTCTNSEAIKNAVIAGRGIAIISKMLITRELETKSLRILPIEGITTQRTIHAIYHKDKFISKTMQQFFDILA